MFCYQCEQTYRGQGCTDLGVCGKDESTATLQDLLVYAAKGIAMYAHRARQAGAADAAIDDFVIDCLFATGTNVNFDPIRLASLIDRAAVVREQAKQLYERACADKGLTAAPLSGAAAWKPAGTIEGLVAQGKQHLIPEQLIAAGPETGNLQELILYGLKGLGAYAAHAKRLGASDAGVNATILEILDFLTMPSPSTDELLGMALRTGELNYRVMQMLDKANTGSYGNPTPTGVRLHPRKGKAIVVSGHDLADLYELLKQTEGTGIQIYTHGEMLPAHGYPKLKAFKHLAGNFGGGWQDQQKEFPDFPGPILMTSNCIQDPKDYKDRVYTTGPVAWPGVRHIANHDYSAVIEAALRAPGYAEDGPDDEILTGFGHNAVLSVAGTVVDAVKAGAIRHFFLIGGCDGARPGRNYTPNSRRPCPTIASS